MTVDVFADPAAREAARSASVEALLQFSERTTEKPYVYAGLPPDGVPQARGQYRSRPVRITNARPFADRLSLDVEGVAVVRRPSAVGDAFDEAQTLAIGHPETAELVKEVTGAARVVVFDHTQRRAGAVDVDDRSSGQPRPPATRVHVDQTLQSGQKRVREIMGSQAETLLAGRAAIINVWRPIAYPARDRPLALGDARSFAPEDLIETDLIFPHRRGETYGIAFNPDQRWLYIPDAAPDEAILIKCWDSAGSVARFAPHGAFEDPTTPPGTPPRQSIEYRTIAFFD